MGFLLIILRNINKYPSSMPYKNKNAEKLTIKVNTGKYNESLPAPRYN